MYHLILTASSDPARLSCHAAIRELDEAGEWRTITTSGLVTPRLSGGLFEDDPVTFAGDSVRAFQQLVEKMRNTHQ
jgi:hypothetical protein